MKKYIHLDTDEVLRFHDDVDALDQCRNIAALERGLESYDLGDAAQRREPLNTRKKQMLFSSQDSSRPAQESCTGF